MYISPQPQQGKPGTSHALEDSCTDRQTVRRVPLHSLAEYVWLPRTAVFSPDSLKVALTQAAADASQLSAIGVFDTTGAILYQSSTILSTSMRPVWSVDSWRLAFWRYLAGGIRDAVVSELGANITEKVVRTCLAHTAVA